jgi:hypothetical protein
MKLLLPAHPGRSRLLWGCPRRQGLPCGTVVGVACGGVSFGRSGKLVPLTPQIVSRSESQAIPYSCFWRGRQPFRGPQPQDHWKRVERPSPPRRQGGGTAPSLFLLSFPVVTVAAAAAHFLARQTTAQGRAQHSPTSCSNGLAVNRGISPATQPQKLRSG